MSVFPKETVNLIAESIGISVKDEVASLLIEDAEYRIREIINESTKFMKHSHRKKLLPSDINSALVLKNIQPLFGYNTKQNFKETNQIYHLDDAEIDLEELINQPLPPVPLETTFTAHWLAIEGVQPRIVQNPTEKEIIVQEERNKPKEGQTKLKTNGPPVKQVLTKELQLYYEKITESIKSTDKTLQQLAIESLSQDPGIQALMPYFVTFVSDTITINLRNLHTCTSMMVMIDSLFKNPHLFIEPYLHQILPAVITCIVAKNLSKDDEDHYATRRFSSQILLNIINNFGTTYHGLQARITKTLVRALLDSSKPLSTIYGSLYALKIMGPEVIGLLVIPHVKPLKLMIDQSSLGKEECDELLLEVCLDHYRANEKKDSLLELYGEYKDSMLMRE